MRAESLEVSRSSLKDLLNEDDHKSKQITELQERGWKYEQEVRALREELAKEKDAHEHTKKLVDIFVDSNASLASNALRTELRVRELEEKLRSRRTSRGKKT